MANMMVDEEPLCLSNRACNAHLLAQEGQGYPMNELRHRRHQFPVSQNNANNATQHHIANKTFWVKIVFWIILGFLLISTVGLIMKVYSITQQLVDSDVLINIQNDLLSVKQQLNTVILDMSHVDIITMQSDIVSIEQQLNELKIRAINETELITTESQDQNDILSIPQQLNDLKNPQIVELEQVIGESTEISSDDCEDDIIYEEIYSKSLDSDKNRYAQSVRFLMKKMKQNIKSKSLNVDWKYYVDKQIEEYLQRSEIGRKVFKLKATNIGQLLNAKIVIEIADINKNEYRLHVTAFIQNITV